MKRYTDFETDFIKINYGKVTNKDLAIKLNRSISSVVDKAATLNLCKERVNKRENKSTRKCIICNSVYPKTKEYFTTFISKRDNEVWLSRCRNCDKFHIQKRNSNELIYLKSLIRGIEKDEKRKSKGFDITFEDVCYLWIKQNKRCKLTGIPLTTLKGKGLLFSNASIDKINPLLGYFKDNIQLVCLWANQSKSNLSIKDFKNMINTTYNYLNNER